MKKLLYSLVLIAMASYLSGLCAVGSEQKTIELQEMESSEQVTTKTVQDTIDLPNVASWFGPTKQELKAWDEYETTYPKALTWKQWKSAQQNESKKWGEYNKQNPDRLTFEEWQNAEKEWQAYLKHVALKMFDQDTQKLLEKSNDQKEQEKIRNERVEARKKIETTSQDGSILDEYEARVVAQQWELGEGAIVFYGDDLYTTDVLETLLVQRKKIVDGYKKAHQELKNDPKELAWLEQEHDAILKDFDEYDVSKILNKLNWVSVKERCGIELGQVVENLYQTRLFQLDDFQQLVEEGTVHSLDKLKILNVLKDITRELSIGRLTAQDFILLLGVLTKTPARKQLAKFVKPYAYDFTWQVTVKNKDGKDQIVEKKATIETLRYNGKRFNNIESPKEDWGLEVWLMSEKAKALSLKNKK